MSEKEVKMKECSRCGDSKPANNEYFCNSKTNYDGLFSWCKVCQKENRVKRMISPHQTQLIRANYLRLKRSMLA